MPATPEVVQFIAAHEGGLSDDGNTNMGVTWDTFVANAGKVGLPPDRDTFNNFTAAQLQKFIDLYWLSGGFSRIANQAVADAFFDWYWMGPVSSTNNIAQALQNTFGKTVDTSQPYALVDAINDIPNQQAVYEAINKARSDYFNRLGQQQPQYADGWNNRTNDAYNAFKGYTGTTLNANAPAPQKSGILPAWAEPLGWGLLAAIVGGSIYKRYQKRAA